MDPQVFCILHLILSNVCGNGSSGLKNFVFRIRWLAAKIQHHVDIPHDGGLDTQSTGTDTDNFMLIEA